MEHTTKKTSQENRASEKIMKKFKKINISGTTPIRSITTII